MTESELREEGFQWDNVLRCFLYNELTVDFERELVQYNPVYKTQLENHLLAGVHGYSKFPSYFWQNMYTYLKNNLAELKELKCYADHIYMLYRQQRENEWNASRQVYKFVDGCGVVRDQWVI